MYSSEMGWSYWNQKKECCFSSPPHPPLKQFDFYFQILWMIKANGWNFKELFCCWCYSKLAHLSNAVRYSHTLDTELDLSLQRVPRCCTLEEHPICSGILEGLGLSLQHQGCGSCETPMHWVVRRNVGTELLVIFWNDCLCYIRALRSLCIHAKVHTDKHTLLLQQAGVELVSAKFLKA